MSTKVSLLLLLSLGLILVALIACIITRKTGTMTDKMLGANTGSDHDSSEVSTPTRFEIPYPKKNISCISMGLPASKLSLIFTNGAKGNINEPAVMELAEGFSESKNIICFQGRSTVQARASMFKTVVEHHYCDVLGGRSIGARAAITAAKEIDNVKTLILVSYPLRGDDGDLRDQLLLNINDDVDVLFVIGDKDGLCDLNELRPLMNRMAAKTWIIVVTNANHYMHMRPLEATTAVGKMVGRIVAKWIEERDNALTNCEVHWDEMQNDVVVSPWNDGL